MPLAHDGKRPIRDGEDVLMVMGSDGPRGCLGSVVLFVESVFLNFKKAKVEVGLCKLSVIFHGCNVLWVVGDAEDAR